jgi:large subunit ribosomal protein L15
VVSDAYDRTPFQHPSLASLDNLNAVLPQNLVDVEKVARYARAIGLDQVLRWKPRLVSFCFSATIFSAAT